MSRTNKAFKGTLASFVQYGLQIILQALLAPLILRVAGQETLGAYAVLVQAMAYLSLTDLGFSVSTSRYLSQAHGFDDGGSYFRQVMSNSRTFALFSNIIFAILCILLSLFIGPLLSLSAETKNQAQLGLYLFAAWSVIRTPLAIYGSALIATQNLAVANLVAIIGNAGRLGLSLGLIAAGFGLVGLITANILAELLTMSLQGWVFNSRYPGTNLSWRIINTKLFSEMFRFGLQALLLTIAYQLVFQSYNLIVGYLYGAVAVSVFYITQMPATILYNLVLRVTDNASPAINELYARKLTDTLRRSFIKLHRYTLLLIIPIAIGIGFLTKPLISLWVGSTQYGGNMMVIALSIFTIMIVISHNSWTFVLAEGRIRTLSIISLTEGIVNLALGITLGSYWGLAGVVWATVTAHLLTASYLQWRAQRNLDISMEEYLRAVVKPLIGPCIAGITIMALITSQMQINSWVKLVTLALVFVSMYVGIIYFVSLEKGEKLWLKNRLRTVFVGINEVKVVD